MRLPRGLLIPFGATLLVFVAACGGGDKDKKSSAISAPPSASGGGASEVIDLSKSAKMLRELRSFRFDMSMKLDVGSGGQGGANSDLGSAFAAAFLGALGDMKVSGAVVAPDQAEMTMKIGGQEMGYVQIKDKAWIKFGSSWQATSADDDFGISASDFFEDFVPQQVFRGVKPTRERVNGVNADHYSLDKKGLQDLAKAMGEDIADFKDITDAKLDIWVTDENVPVRLVMAISGKDGSGQKMSMNLELNVRDINDASIKIKPPI